MRGETSSRTLSSPLAYDKPRYGQDTVTSRGWSSLLSVVNIRTTKAVIKKLPNFSRTQTPCSSLASHQIPLRHALRTRISLYGMVLPDVRGFGLFRSHNTSSVMVQMSLWKSCWTVFLHLCSHGSAPSSLAIKMIWKQLFIFCVICKKKWIHNHRWVTFNHLMYFIWSLSQESC